MIIKGDINGDGRITHLDALLLKWHQLEGIKLTGDAFIAADVNGDGKLSTVDAVRINKHLLGITIINEVVD